MRAPSIPGSLKALIIWIALLAALMYAAVSLTKRPPPPTLSAQSGHDGKPHARLDALEEARTIGADWLRAIGAVPNEYLFYYYCHREAMARIHQDQTRGEYLRDQQEAFYNAVLAGPEQAGQTWIDALADREPRPATSTSVPAGAPRILRAAATKRWPSTS